MKTHKCENCGKLFDNFRICDECGALVTKVPSEREGWIPWKEERGYKA